MTEEEFLDKHNPTPEERRALNPQSDQDMHPEVRPGSQPLGEIRWASLVAALSKEIEYEVKPKAVYARGEGFVALALGYISREHVQRRLDSACGAGNWQTQFTVIDKEKKVVECRMGLRLAEVGDWVWKTDAGSGQGESEGDEWKGAYSDAFKRAATHWGVGRFLYDIKAKYLPCKAEIINGKPKFRGWIGDANPTTGETTTPTGGQPAQEVTDPTQLDEWVAAIKQHGPLACNACGQSGRPQYTAGSAKSPKHLAVYCDNGQCENRKKRGYCYPVEKAHLFNKKPPEALKEGEYIE